MKNHYRKFTEEQIRIIRAIPVDPERNPHKNPSISSIARDFGVTRVAIRKIRSGHTYKNVPPEPK